jgi:MinD-like ATPase involved in chromosome partitioning or flagellar assembly
VEADPDGGVLAARFGLAYEPGLVNLAAVARRGLDEADVAAHSQVLGNHGLAVLAAPTLPEQVAGALAVVAAPLADALAAMRDAAVVVDAGRAWPSAPTVGAFLERADVIFLVARPRLEEVQQLGARWRAARAQNERVGVVLVGNRPYAPDEVAAAVEPMEASLVVWGVLPNDPLGAEVLNGRRFAPAWGMRKTQLVRSARTIAARAAARLGLTNASAGGNGQDSPRRRGRLRAGERKS